MTARPRATELGDREPRLILAPADAAIFTGEQAGVERARVNAARIVRIHGEAANVGIAEQRLGVDRAPAVEGEGAHAIVGDREDAGAIGHRSSLALPDPDGHRQLVLGPSEHAR